MFFLLVEVYLGICSCSLYFYFFEKMIKLRWYVEKLFYDTTYCGYFD